MSTKTKRSTQKGIGMPYFPNSRVKSLAIETPDSMAYEMDYALHSLQKNISVSIDEYVRQKLQYKNLVELSNAFYAEQIDALGLAIYNIEQRGQGIIIGDQTGIGKGRIAAGVIRYCLHNDMLPVFLTEKPNLFSDMYRDLIGIGAETGEQVLQLNVGEVEKKVRYEKWENLTQAEKDEYGDEQAYLDFQQENPTEKVISYKSSKYGFTLSESNIDELGNLKQKFSENKSQAQKGISKQVIPFIVNGKEKKTQIKDEFGNILYEPFETNLQRSVIESMNLPKGIDVVMATYSQFGFSTNKINKENPKYNEDNGDEGQAKTKKVKPKDLPINQVEAHFDNKSKFLMSLVRNRKVVFIMDESHNASGASGIGVILKRILQEAAGVAFLSATFAKRADNMPIYANKTAMQEANLNDENLTLAIEKGGVALQEVISSQLVSVGQYVRRERSYEGIEVNYITLNKDGGKEVPNPDQNELKFQETFCTKEQAISDRKRSDAITEIIRDIIEFQKEFIDPEIEELDSIAAPSQSKVERRKGTESAGVDNTPFVSKIFNVINQMLFAIKAEATAQRAIMRLKQGKKVVIAFSNTMGSFIESMSDESGVQLDTGTKINADFSTVLMRGLDTVIRYTETDEKGKKKYKKFDIAEMSPDAQVKYLFIAQKIKGAASGIVLSPIDLVKQIIENEGYKVAEVTGRATSLELRKENMTDLQASKLMFSDSTVKSSNTQNSELPPTVARFMPNYQKVVVEGNEELYGVMESLEQELKAIPKLYTYDKVFQQAQKNSGGKVSSLDTTLVHAHFFNASSDWFISEWDGKDLLYGYAILNGDFENSEFGYIPLSAFLNYSEKYSMGRSPELDFYFGKPIPLRKALKQRGYLDTEGLGKIKRKKKNISLGELVLDDKQAKTRWIGIIRNRPKENAVDAFRKFQNNEVDVLMINQSGSTGASAHAIVTKKVPQKEVKQRCMIVLQSELDISREIQKRGRINRTGQIYSPIYDYITSDIPAEKRLMMMLRKKLKSLDANTTSNQRTSEAILKSDDFLNKYGDIVVKDFLVENDEFNDSIFDPLKLNDPENSSGIVNAAQKVSGRVAVLSTKEQDFFYNEITENYQQFVEMKMDAGEYDLEVEVMNLEAKTIRTQTLIFGKGGDTPFGGDTIEEFCEVNELKKPLSVEGLKDLLETNLDGGKSPQEINRNIFEGLKAYLNTTLENKKADLDEKLKKNIANIPNNGAYKKAEKELNKMDLSDFERENRLNEVASGIKIELEEASELAKEKEEAKIENLIKFYGSNFFNFFFTGNVIAFPEGSLDEISKKDNTRTTFGVFAGWKINKSKKNPYSPGSIAMQFAIASSKRIVTLTLGPQGRLKVLAIKAVSSANDYLRPDLLMARWKNEISKNYSDRTTRYIITGNLLQAYGDENLIQYKLKLIQFTTQDGRVRKGILMPYDYGIQSASKPQSKPVTIPIQKGITLIQGLVLNGSVECTSDITIVKKDFSNYVLYVPGSQAKGGKIFLDTDLASLVNGRNFKIVSNVASATFPNENLKAICKVLQEKHSVSIITTQEKIANSGIKSDNQGVEELQTSQSGFLRKPTKAIAPEIQVQEDLKLILALRRKQNLN